MMSIKSIIYFFVALLLLGVLSCIENNNVCEGRYYFPLPLSIEPDNAVFQIGDTLDIVFRTDNTALLDTLAVIREVEFPFFDPFIFFYLPSLDDTLAHSDGFKDHEVLIGPEYVIDRRNSGLSDVDSIHFKEFPTGAEESLISFRIVMRKTGTYALYTQTMLGLVDSLEPIDFPQRCKIGTSFLESGINIERNNEEIRTDINKSSEVVFWSDYPFKRYLNEPFYFKVGVDIYFSNRKKPSQLQTPTIELISSAQSNCKKKSPSFI